MILRQVLELFDLLDTPSANGKQITDLLKERGAHEVTVETVTSEKGQHRLHHCTDQGQQRKIKRRQRTDSRVLSDVWAVWAHVRN